MTTEKSIIIVLGRICSGKGTYAKQYFSSTIGYKQYTHVATSDVVKELTGSLSREQLQQTSHLDQTIADHLLNLIDKHTCIIIDGIRQVSIIRKIIDTHGSAVSLVWLEVPTSVREARYLARQHSKDTRSFQEAENGDISLGINEVESTFKPMCNVIHYL